MMKFLTDVNASGAVAAWLTKAGFDVAQVSAVDTCMTDEEILRWANREQRVIVTTDKDFEEMVWREGKRHCGLLRIENLPRYQRQSLLEYVLAHHSGELEAGAVVIALETKIRVRWSHDR